MHCMYVLIYIYLERAALKFPFYNTIYKSGSLLFFFFLLRTFNFEFESKYFIVLTAFLNKIIFSIIGKIFVFLFLLRRKFQKFYFKYSYLHENS